MSPSSTPKVLRAQTRANMWVRNGYSILNQLYNYGRHATIGAQASLVLQILLSRSQSLYLLDFVFF